MLSTKWRPSFFQNPNIFTNYYYGERCVFVVFSESKKFSHTTYSVNLNNSDSQDFVSHLNTRQLKIILLVNERRWNLRFYGQNCLVFHLGIPRSRCDRRYFFEAHLKSRFSGNFVFPITSFSVAKTIWNFAKNATIISQCSVQWNGCCGGMTFRDIWV